MDQVRSATDAQNKPEKRIPAGLDRLSEVIELVSGQVGAMEMALVGVLQPAPPAQPEPASSAPQGGLVDILDGFIQREERLVQRLSDIRNRLEL